MSREKILSLLLEQGGFLCVRRGHEPDAGHQPGGGVEGCGAVKARGYGIESVPNRGYRLTRVTARLRQRSCRSSSGIVGSAGNCCTLTPSTPPTTN